MFGRSALVLLCGLLAASPLAAQTVELSSRTFWLGEQPATMDDYPPFFAPQRIRWIEKIIDADPVLGNTVPHVELALLPASESVGDVGGAYVPVGSDRLDPRYDLPGYNIFGLPDDPTRLPVSIVYQPQDPGAGYRVSCSVDNVREKLRFCLVIATYPPDDGIRLKIRLYFPDDPAAHPDYFREVVERMRDLVYCLDVTDELVDVQKNRPTLAGCQPEVSS